MAAAELRRGGITLARQPRGDADVTIDIRTLDKIETTDQCANN
jgi:hypothetical protein